MANANTLNTPRGWQVKIDNSGVLTLGKASNLGGSVSSVTFPATGSGAGGAISLEDARELALAILCVVT